MKHYILFVYNDIEPEIRGPYTSAEIRDQTAKQMRKNYGEQEHGIFALDAKSKPQVSAYSAGFMEDK